LSQANKHLHINLKLQIYIHPLIIENVESENLIRLKEIEGNLAPLMLEHMKLFNSLSLEEKTSFIDWLKARPYKDDFAKEAKDFVSAYHQPPQPSNSRGIADILREKGTEILGYDLMGQCFYEACKVNGGWFNPVDDPEKAFRLMMPIAAKKLFSNEDMVNAMVEETLKNPTNDSFFEDIKKQAQENRKTNPFKTWRSYERQADPFGPLKMLLDDKDDKQDPHTKKRTAGTASASVTKKDE
jgi:hypothetical protein